MPTSLSTKKKKKTSEGSVVRQQKRHPSDVRLTVFEKKRKKDRRQKRLIRSRAVDLRFNREHCPCSRTVCMTDVLIRAKDATDQ